MAVSANWATVGAQGRAEACWWWAWARSSHQRRRTYRRTPVHLACCACRCRLTAAAAQWSMSTAAAQDRARAEVGTTSSCAAKSRPLLRPAASCTPAGTPTALAALKARLAACEVGGEAATRAPPVGGPLARTGRNRGTAARHAPAASSPSAAAAAVAADASPEALLQHTLHGL